MNLPAKVEQDVGSSDRETLGRKEPTSLFQADVVLDTFKAVALRCSIKFSTGSDGPLSKFHSYHLADLI